jgi:integrase
MAASGSALLPSIVWLAVETAMRRGEIVALRWEHVDVKRRVAHLPAMKNRSARDVPLSSRAVAVFEAIKEARDAAIEESDDDGHAAGSGRGFSMSAAMLSRGHLSGW